MLSSGKWQRLGLDLLKEVHRELYLLSRERDTTMAILARRAIDQFLREIREQKRKGGLYKV